MKVLPLLRAMGFALVATYVVLLTGCAGSDPKAAAPTSPRAEQETKEAQLRANLSELRNACYKFHEDTNYWPLALADLTAKSISDLSIPNTAVDGQGVRQRIARGSFHGPYIKALLSDPLPGDEIQYSLAPGTVGNVSSKMKGDGALDHTPYTYPTW